MYKGTLIAVKDMEKSKKFYQDILKMNIVGDFGANVQLDGGLFLQTLDTWQGFIGGRDVSLRNNAGELYFEVSDIDSFCQILQHFHVEYVHEPLEHRWGQRVVRFYDPDCHIIEVAEELAVVVRRFYDSGMSARQVAVRMDIPVEYVNACLQK